jgi:uncharacterized membrane protein
MESSAGYNIALFIRYLHVLSGIFWIGLLYFFNVVNVQTMKALDGATKGKLVPILMPRALAWFRWAALATFIFGVLLLFSPSVYASPSQWDWKIQTGVTLATIMFLNVWGIIWRCQKKVIAMTAAAAASGTAPPPEMAKLARTAYLASRTNFWLSFPMLWFMIWAAHS